MVGVMFSVAFLIVMPAIPFFSKDPLITTKSVLEISDSLQGNQQLVISRAKKLCVTLPGKHIEVVAVGKGIDLLLSDYDSANQHEIQSLMRRGVVFSICQHSLQELTHRLGRPIQIIEGVQRVPDGRCYADDLKNNGYLDILA